MLNRTVILSSLSLATFIAMIFLSSCNGCCSLRIPIPPCLCFNGRRPQVMAHAETCVIDYNPDEEGCKESGCVIESEGVGACEEGCNLGRTPTIRITPDMLDPTVHSAQSYKLAIGDHLEIAIFGDEDTVASRVVIASDGKIYYTFLEGIVAAGRTIPEVSEEIASKLGHLFLNPVVTIIPLTSVNNIYKILGRVQLPGVYRINGPMRLRDAIGEAGGLLTESFKDKDRDADLLPLANLHASFVIRDKKKIRVDFEKLLYTGDESQNIFIRPGDYVYIAPSDHAEVYVLGNVRGARSMTYTRGLTLMQALASTGGWTSGYAYAADISRVIVLRGNLECPCVAEIDLCLILQGKARDLYLQPGDIVYVPDKQMRFGRELVRLAIFTFVDSFATGAGSYYGDILFPNVTNCGLNNGTTGTVTPVTPVVP